MNQLPNNNPDNNGPSGDGWWARCRREMAKVKDFSLEYAQKSSGVIGKLYYASLAVGFCSTAAALYGVPGALVVSTAAFGSAKMIKTLWDHVRDVQDAAEELIETGEQDRAIEKIDAATARILELEGQLREYETVTKELAQSNDSLRSSHRSMQEALELNTQEMSKIRQSHDALTEALKVMVAAQKQSDPNLPSDQREQFRQQYLSELTDALNSGEIKKVPFDEDRDNLVRLEEDEPADTPSMH